jgi:hypothetical protein
MKNETHGDWSHRGLLVLGELVHRLSNIAGVLVNPYACLRTTPTQAEGYEVRITNDE